MEDLLTLMKFCFLLPHVTVILFKNTFICVALVWLGLIPLYGSQSRWESRSTSQFAVKKSLSGLDLLSIFSSITPEISHKAKSVKCHCYLDNHGVLPLQSIGKQIIKMSSMRINLGNKKVG